MTRKTFGKAYALNPNPVPQPNRHLVLPTYEQWLSTAEIISLFNVSARTLLRWRTNNLIPFIRLGGTVFYPANLVNKILINKVQPPHVKKRT